MVAPTQTCPCPPTVLIFLTLSLLTIHMDRDPLLVQIFGHPMPLLDLYFNSQILNSTSTAMAGTWENVLSLCNQISSIRMIYMFGLKQCVSHYLYRIEI